MRINYLKYQLYIKLEKSVSFYTFPAFVFRSVFGNSLKRLVCITNMRDCAGCSLSKQCAYSYLFETPVDKSNNVLEGRNKAPHPFILSVNCNEGQRVNEFTVDFTLVGNSIKYFPYVYYAFKRAGEFGILKDRVKFNVTDVKVNDKSIILAENSINTGVSPAVFSLETNGEFKKETLHIEFVTPVRLKLDGKIKFNLSYKDVINSSLRRLNILNGFYGSKTKVELKESDLHCIEKKSVKPYLNWIDLERYSARQKTTMMLGGVIGIMKVDGDFSPFELSLLKGGELFHIGKNISFGLGKIKVNGGEI